MGALQRVSVAIIEIGIFFGVCAGLSGSLDFVLNSNSPFNLLFVSSAVFIILGKYIAEPFFTSPMGSISNSIAALLIIFSIQDKASFILYWPLLVFFAFIFLSSLVVLLLNNSSRFERLKMVLLTISTRFGRSSALYSGIYLLGSVSLLHARPLALTIMLVLWAIVVCTPMIENIVGALFSLREKDAFSENKGLIKGTIADRLYTVLFNSLDSKQLSDSVIFVELDGDIFKACLPLKMEVLTEGTIITAVQISEQAYSYEAIGQKGISKTVHPSNSLLVPLSKLPETTINSFSSSPIFINKDRIIGVVDCGSDIEKIRVKLTIDEQSGLYSLVREGTVIETVINGKACMYQAINGVVSEEKYLPNEEEGYISLHARKLGEYDKDALTIKEVPWLPENAAVVWLHQSKEDRVAVDASIGVLPGTRYPIPIHNIDALVTHNTAILGILGVGKSCLAFELIQKVVVLSRSQNSRIRVICIDVTGEYATTLPQYGAECTIPENEELIKSLIAQKNNAVKAKDEGGNHLVFRNGMRAIIDCFMGDDNGPQVLVINPEQYPVTKQTTDGKSSNYGKPPYDLTPFADLTAAEITRIISEEALDYCKTSYSGGSLEARLLLVFEEAHTLIPEWSSAANEGDRNAANGTARVILQGRKYGLGSMVITQRTANVSKSILNQCNTIFALRVFDDTGKQFLENYVGRDYAALLPTLEERHAIVSGRALALTCPVEIALNDKSDVTNHSVIVNPSNGVHIEGIAAGNVDETSEHQTVEGFNDSSEEYIF